MAQFVQELPSHQPVPAGLRSTFSKLFSSNWGSESSGSGSSADSGGGGLIAAFRAMMPKTSNSDLGNLPKQLKTGPGLKASWLYITHIVTACFI
jgi:hypothetical protein